METSFLLITFQMEFQEKKQKFYIIPVKSYIKDYVHKIKSDVIMDLATKIHYEIIF